MIGPYVEKDQLHVPLIWTIITTFKIPFIMPNKKILGGKGLFETHGRQ